MDKHLSCLFMSCFKISQDFFFRIIVIFIKKCAIMTSRCWNLQFMAISPILFINRFMSIVPSLLYRLHNLFSIFIDVFIPWDNDGFRARYPCLKPSYENSVIDITKFTIEHGISSLYITGMLNTIPIYFNHLGGKTFHVCHRANTLLNDLLTDGTQTG